MHEDLSRDPFRDPELEAALRDLGPEPPLESVDWERLRDRLEAPARRLLARRRASWWDYAASWARPAIPATLAASAALVWLLSAPLARDPAPGPSAAAAEPGLEEVLYAEAMIATPFGGLGLVDDADALLEAAVRLEE